MKTILILHDLSVGSRRTNRDHVYNFAKYEKGNLYVFHSANGPQTSAMREVQWDGVIMNYCFLGHRVSPRFPDVRKRWEWLSHLDCPKVAICQDDYTESALLDEWLQELRVDTIYSPIQDDVCELYPRNWGWRDFRLGLTAYVDSAQIKELSRFASPWGKRKYDVGTRVRFLPPQFGRYGRMKGVVAEEFGEVASIAGFKVNVSTSPYDVKFGDEWLKFIGNCRFTLGSKGGSSLNDPYGKIRRKIDSYMETHPDAGFAEVEKFCFDGLDGQFKFAGVSPRLFESAALRTCQILIKDDYVGGLEPYVDYIPLDPDFENLEEVFALMRDETSCLSMIESCYKKLISSKAFDYASFVSEVLDTFGSTPDEAISINELKVAEHIDVIGKYVAVRDLIPSGRLAQRTWQRCVAYGVHLGMSSEMLTLLSQKEDFLGTPSELTALFGNLGFIPSFENMGTLLETISTLEPRANASLLKVAEDASAQSNSFIDNDIWWDMCEYIYEPENRV